MGTDTDMGLALNRRANVFNSLTIDSNPSKDVMGFHFGFVFCGLRQGKQLHVRDSNVHCPRG
jgi:hypothetical protein